MTTFVYLVYYGYFDILFLLILILHLFLVAKKHILDNNFKYKYDEMLMSSLGGSGSFSSVSYNDFEFIIYELTMKRKTGMHEWRYTVVLFIR